MEGLSRYDTRNILKMLDLVVFQNWKPRLVWNLISQEITLESAKMDFGALNQMALRVLNWNVCRQIKVEKSLMTRIDTSYQDRFKTTCKVRYLDDIRVQDQSWSNIIDRFLNQIIRRNAKEASVILPKLLEWFSRKLWNHFWYHSTCWLFPKEKLEKESLFPVYCCIFSKVIQFTSETEAPFGYP